MACIPAIPATCVAPAVGAVSDGMAAGFAGSMKEGAAWVIQTTIGWWIDVPAIDLAASPVATIRGYVLWIAVILATAGVIWQGIVLAVSRRPEPMLTVVKGLIVVALWSAIGIIGPAAALEAGDSFSSWVLGEAAGGEVSDRLVALYNLESIQSTGAVIILGLLLMLAGLVQAFFMMFREGTIVILAGLTVLAAAGHFTGATRRWLAKVLGWMIALICYKPAAALVYASALALVGEGDDARTVFVGMSMMLIAIVALPALMKLFTWTTGSLAAGGGGGMLALSGLSAAAMQAQAATSRSAGGASAQAANIKADMAPANGSPAGATATPAPTPPTGSTAAAAGSTGAAAGSSTASGAASSAGSGAAAGGGAAAAAPVAGAAVVGFEAAKVAAKAGKATGAEMTKDG